MENEKDYQSEEQSNAGCFAKAGGCLLKAAGMAIFMIIMFIGNSLVKTCTKQQMRKAMQEQYSSLPAEERLQNGLEEVRKTLPHQIDDVTTCTDITLTSDAYTYVYTINQSVDFSTVDFSTFDRQTKADIRSSKSKLSLVAKLCNETGRKICYKYVSARNGDTHTIEFIAKELL